MSLEATLSQIEKKFGKGTVQKASAMKRLEIERISTGSLSFDIESGGGFPCGRIVELFGDEGSGKTLISLKTVMEAQKLDKKVVWLDIEGVFDKDWANCVGVDVEKLELVKTEGGEKALDILDMIVRSGDCGMVVLDSVAALIPTLELETSMEDPEKLGDKALMMNRAVRKLHSALNVKTGEDLVPNNCLVLLINQIREKIGVYGDPTVTPGGRGLKFGASIRVHLRRGELLKEKIKGEDIVVGQVIKGKTVKNKTYSPYRTFAFNFYFGGSKKGKIDTSKEIITYCLLSGLVKQAGPMYTINGNKFKGKEKLIEYLKEKKMLGKLRKQAIELMLQG